MSLEKNQNRDLIIGYWKRSPVPLGWCDDQGEIKTGIFYSVNENKSNNETVKHHYLADFKPIDELLTLNYHALIVLRAFLPSSFVIVNDFSNFENNEIRKMANDPDYEPQQYDWYRQLPRFYDLFLFDAGRLEFVGFCRKMIEEYCFHNFSERFTDKLTKDVKKSFLRKVERCTRFEASSRIIKTQAMGSLISYSSLFLVDNLISFYPALREVAKTISKKGLVKGLKTLRAAGIIMTVVNKAVLTAVSWSLAAIGYGVGSYIHKEGGMWGSAFFELIGTLTSLLLPPAPPICVLDECEEDDDEDNSNN